MLALDGHGDPLTGVITWADGRAVEQSRALRGLPLASRLYQETGCPVHGMYPLYKIMWLRDKRRDVFGKTWRYVSAKEYVFARLTGEYLVDYSLAAGSAFLNTHTLRWNPLCLEMAGIREDQLSSLCSPLTVHRGLNPELGSRDGHSRRCPGRGGLFGCCQFQFGCRRSVIPGRRPVWWARAERSGSSPPARSLMKRLAAGVTPSMKATGLWEVRSTMGAWRCPGSGTA